MKKVYRFTASWCQPCKALASILEDIKTDVPIEVIDIDENKQAAIQYKVRGVPTLVYVDETGNELKRMTGVQTKKNIESWLND